MTDAQLYLAIGVPFFSLLVVFLMNNRSIDALRSEMRDGFARIDARFVQIDGHLGNIQRDLREFYGTQRQHDNRLDAIERKQPS